MNCFGTEANGTGRIDNVYLSSDVRQDETGSGRVQLRLDARRNLKLGCHAPIWGEGDRLEAAPRRAVPQLELTAVVRHRHQEPPHPAVKQRSLVLHISHNITDPHVIPSELHYQRYHSPDSP